MTAPVVVGRVGRAHGVHGEVAVQVRTDAPELRFAPGSVLTSDRPEVGPLTVEAARPHSGRWLVRFRGVPDRPAAQALTGALLLLDPAAAGDAGEDAWWDHELAGLRVVTPAGEPLGVVDDVVHTAGGDLLSVRRPDGREALVPFVRAIVPEVDPAAGRVVVDPPPGLLEL
jgi:16S rRNA processing protein RimM